ncbi:MAG: hypothetical protein ABI351_13235 [Herbaspirillum sp.]
MSAFAADELASDDFELLLEDATAAASEASTSGLFCNPCESVDPSLELTECDSDCVTAGLLLVFGAKLVDTGGDELVVPGGVDGGVGAVVADGVFVTVFAGGGTPQPPFSTRSPTIQLGGGE